MQNFKRPFSLAISAARSICTDARARYVLGGLAILLTSLAVGLVLPAPSTAQNFVDFKPTPQQLEWQDLEFGVIVHFGLNTFTDRKSVV